MTYRPIKAQPANSDSAGAERLIHCRRDDEGLRSCIYTFWHSVQGLSAEEPGRDLCSLARLHYDHWQRAIGERWPHCQSALFRRECQTGRGLSE